MKVLRIYDHLGELKKEFNVYVEGEDFKWQSSYPEPVWLGTITLEELGKEPEKPGELMAQTEMLEPEAVEIRAEGAPETKVVEVYAQSEKASVEDVLDLTQVVEEKLVEAEGKIEEVKDGPKKLRTKGKRDKRAGAPGSA